MGYSLINAVSWAEVQVDKKSCASSVKPPPQVSNTMSVSGQGVRDPSTCTLQWVIPLFEKTSRHSLRVKLWKVKESLSFGF